MKNKILIVLFCLYVFGFGFYSLIDTDKEISLTERRKLDTFPKVELTNEYADKLDSYLVDQFPLREEYRSIKANYNYYVLNMLVNNNIYIKDNYIFKSEYPTNISSIENLKKHLNKTKSKFGKKNNVYMLLVPDKNYYLESEEFLNIEYDYIYDEIKDVDEINFIDIRNLMNVNDYYETDTHWKQENLGKVVNALVTNMGYEYKMVDYEVNEYEKFYGVYYGESAIKRNPEVLKYLINEEINKVKVEHLESGKSNKVYNTDKLIGMDSYDVYLDGATAYIEITNDNTKSKKELIIFRDSFGSSLAPLLIPYYKKITIIDNRYINSDYYLQKVDFKKQDVLFVYSTLIANNSFTLKN